MLFLQQSSSARRAPRPYPNSATVFNSAAAAVDVVLRDKLAGISDFDGRLYDKLCGHAKIVAKDCNPAHIARYRQKIVFTRELIGLWEPAEKTNLDNLLEYLDQRVAYEAELRNLAPSHSPIPSIAATA